MKTTYEFRFNDGVTEKGNFELTFNEARLKAKGEAKSSGLPQTVYVYSREQFRWKKLGTWYPEGFYLDGLNWVNVMNNDDDGLFAIGKLGAEYTLDYVLSRQNDYARIINSAQNEIEYENGLLFVYNPNTQNYRLSVKKGGEA